MKILYGIQGTGNGHLSRAMEIIPHLQERAQVDVLISGNQSELELPFEVKYTMHGLGFVFGKKGGIDLVETYKKSRLKKFYNEVRDLDVGEYDVVISDFEPVTAWACIRNNKTCIGLSNQASLLFNEVPKASTEDFVGRFIIRNYAPCSLNFGFGYERYNDRVYTPIIRASLRESVLSNEGHYTVYLPSFNDEKIISTLKLVKGAKWHVFSKRAISAYSIGNIDVLPLDKQSFERSITSSAGVLSAAGFGTTTEALFMGKKLLVIPQKQQYEQACNAEALRKLGVRVIKSIKSKHLEKIQYWVDHGTPVQINYADQTSDLVNDIIFSYHNSEDPYIEYLEREQYTLKSA